MEDFQKVSINGRMNVSLQADSSNFIEIQYGDNIIKGIASRVENGTLYLDEVNRCDWIRKQDPLPEVSIHYAELNHLYSKCAGSVRFSSPYLGDTLNVEVEDAAGDLELDLLCNALNLIVHTGATERRVTGTTAYTYIYNSGYAPIHAEALISTSASVHNNASGDTYIHAEDILYYQIYHVGNVLLQGPAEAVKWHQSGGGSLQRLP